MLTEVISSAQTAEVIGGISRSGIVESTIQRIQLLIEENLTRMGSIIDDLTYLITGISSKNKKWEFCTLEDTKKGKGVRWNCPT